MNVIRTLGDPANGIRASKGGQTVQVERVAAMRKPPENREVVRGVDNWNAAGCALDNFWRMILSNTGKGPGQVSY
jgi:hypothetical protein